MATNDILQSAPVACPVCGCTRAPDVHAIAAAVREGDLDAALDAGLLDFAPCASCAVACTQALHAARAERMTALAARERFRAREARLLRRQQERLARRSNTTQAPMVDAAPATTSPALPPAAAAALARAKARAAGRTTP